MRTGVQLLRLCSSPGVSTEGRGGGWGGGGGGSALGLGHVSSRDPREKWRARSRPPSSLESRLGTTCQTNSQRAAGGGVCPRGTLDEARSTLRT